MGNDGTVIVDATYLKLAGPAGVAIELDGAEARLIDGTRAPGERRQALVHAAGDRLLVNYAGEFLGGVEVQGGPGKVSVKGDGHVLLEAPKGVEVTGILTVNGGKLVLSYVEHIGVEVPDVGRPRPFGVIPRMEVRQDVQLDVLQEILSLRRRLEVAEQQLAELRR